MNIKNLLLVLAISFSINILCETYIGRICISTEDNPIERLSTNCCLRYPHYIINIDRGEDIAIVVVIELDKSLSMNSYCQTKEFLFNLPLNIFVTILDNKKVFKKTGDIIELKTIDKNILELTLDKSFDKLDFWANEFMQEEKLGSKNYCLIQ